MNKSILSLIVLMSVICLGNQAQAQNNLNQNQTTGQTNQKIEKSKTNADKVLDKRLEDLDKLTIRIGEFKNVSDTDKKAMITLVNGLVSELNRLKSDIELATSSEAVKTLRESITKNYRVYGLFMPKMHITAAIDRINTTISMMIVIASKIEMRLNNIATSTAITSANLNSAQKTLSDLKDKLVEAKKEAQLAMEIIAPLVPDQGDKSVYEANLVALKSARAKIKLSYANLHDAREDAQIISKLLAKEIKPNKASTTPISQ